MMMLSRPTRQYPWERPKPRYKNARLTWYLLASSVLFGIFLLQEEKNAATHDNNGFRRLTPDVIITPDITPFGLICPAEYPPTHAKIHDSNPDKMKHYNDTYSNTVKQWNAHPEFPDVLVLENSFYAAWTSTSLKSEASAWSGKRWVQGAGWSEPKQQQLSSNDIIELEGEYVAYHTWGLGLFGHFVHDWLPTVAYLRDITSPTSKFLLVDHPTSRQYLSFLDSKFYGDRVVWIQQDQIFHIKGNLTVQIPFDIPYVYGCCYGWDPLRQWIAEKHREQIPNEEVPRKHVLFYSRTNVTSAENGREIDPTMEHRMMAAIRYKLKQHGRHERVVRFTGEDREGNVLPIAQQFALLRGASTWIGPHGGALGGNFAWMDPFATNCEERPQILEFIPGSSSAELPLYASTYGNIRKWPVDYHTILYTPDEINNFSSVDMHQFNIALDAMWGGKKKAAALDDNTVISIGSTIEVKE